MRRLLLALALWLSAAAPVAADVAFLSATSGQFTNADPSIANIDSTGANFVVALLSWDQNDGQDPSGCTWGASAMTLASSLDNNGWVGAAVFYFANPTGIATVSCTYILGAADPNNILVVALFSGAGSVGTAAANENITATSTAISGTVTSGLTGMVVDVVSVLASVSASLTVDVGQTERSKVQHTVSTLTAGVSTEPGDASVTSGWTWTGGARVAHIVVPIIASGAAAAAPKRWPFISIG